MRLIEIQTVEVDGEVWEVSEAGEGYYCESVKCDPPGSDAVPQEQWREADVELWLQNTEHTVWKCLCADCFKEWSGKTVEDVL